MTFTLRETEDGTHTITCDQCGEARTSIWRIPVLAEWRRAHVCPRTPSKEGRP